VKIRRKKSRECIVVLLALDFDGVLRKWPRPIEIYANFLAPNDLLVRAKLYHLRRLLCRLCFDYTPIILDGKMINGANNWDGEIVIVTGRSLRNISQANKVLEGKIRCKIYFRENLEESEESYKYRVLKELKVDYFIDDRACIVNYLRKKGINAIHVREIRK